MGVGKGAHLKSMPWEWDLPVWTVEYSVMIGKVKVRKCVEIKRDYWSFFSFLSFFFFKDPINIVWNV